MEFGSTNGHIVGSLMKEAARRAIQAIRKERFRFETEVKGRRAGGGLDLVTTADRAAQQVYVKLLRDWFEDCGIVAEEEELRVPGRGPLWFTVDPLDGTSAFVRRQSHGIGTMLALCHEDRVIGAVVGDVMTEELYAWRPGDTHVWRISEFGIPEELTVDPERTLADQWALVQGSPRSWPALEAFEGWETMAGSVGVGFARLWKGEVGGVLMHPQALTPWDVCPVVGISEVLGFVFLTPSGRPWSFRVQATVQPSPGPLLCVHRSRVEELMASAGG